MKRLNKHQRLVIRELRKLADQIERQETYCSNIYVTRPEIIHVNTLRDLDYLPTGEATIEVTVLPGPSPW